MKTEGGSSLFLMNKTKGYEGLRAFSHNSCPSLFLDGISLRLFGVWVGLTSPRDTEGRMRRMCL